jgi:hypothetical protein
VTNLINIKEVGQLMGYRDLRSVRKWLADRNIPVMRLGKGEFSDKEIFEATVANIMNSHKNNTVEKRNTTGKLYKPQSETEIKFAQDLLLYLDRANVVDHGN